MRSLLFVAALFLLVPVTAAAQDYPKAEVTGAYSYLRADEGDNLHGWNASIAGNLNKWFGVVADFSGHYGQDFLRVSAPPIFIDAESDVNLHAFLFGPRFSYREHRTIEAFVHALAGGARSRVEASINVPGLSTQIRDTETGFAAAIGGGIDAKFGKNFAWRVFQTDYLLTRFDDENQHNFRLSTGIVIRFGTQ